MKLYTSLLEKIYTTHLTKKELDTLLFLLQVQDELGTILNVHWKEIALKANMVAQSFYNAVDGLALKGFIKVSNNCPCGTKNGRGFHTIQILVPSAPVELQTDGEVISQDNLQTYIKECGSYLNLKNCSLVNTIIFRSLRPDSKKLVLNLLWKRQSIMGLYGKKGIKAHDIHLTLQAAANLLGFNWERGKKGEVVRRKVKRYFDAIIASGLLPVTLDEEYTLHWTLEDMRKPLPEQPLHMDCPNSEFDSIADTSNRRVINTVLAQNKIEADSQEIQDALTVLDNQFKHASGLKILAAGVKGIIIDCVKHYSALIPAYINKKCRELLSYKRDFLHVKHSLNPA